MALPATLAARRPQLAKRARLRARLRRHRLDRGYSFEALRDAIQDATNVRISPPTLMRFLADEYYTSEIVIHTLQRYLAAFKRVQL